MRSTKPTLASLLLVVPALLAACADPSALDDTSVPVMEAPATGAVDHEASPPAEVGATRGAPVSSDRAYPAPHPSMPQIPRNGGPVLHDPSIVTVTFAGDAMEAKLQAFGDQVGSLGWWSTVHVGYGVGPATSAGHVVVPTAPPATMSDTQVQAWVAARIGDGTLPAPTDQSIYMLYYPQATTITIDDGGAAPPRARSFSGTTAPSTSPSPARRSPSPTRSSTAAAATSTRSPSPRATSSPRRPPIRAPSTTRRPAT